MPRLKPLILSYKIKEVHIDAEIIQDFEFMWSNMSIFDKIYLIFTDKLRVKKGLL